MHLGVHCTYDNQQLAASVDVFFLCCQLFQLMWFPPRSGAHISKTCIVYSLVTAVPARRLQHLLGHSQYSEATVYLPRRSVALSVGKNKNIVEGLLVQEVVEETSPFKDKIPSPGSTCLLCLHGTRPSQGSLTCTRDCSSISASCTA
ncbi:NADP-dependent oxidoreductase domain-containing protein 1 [Pristis pectinata]|uniref:NADP-dependent oxidoreductase domain-containing protein 1 n=1 Tax=Pristis pectinata TaxID=685728 RepID=UPI00223E5B47|nr:NADP-dependent oxidoreductase domain-containing protein 1 [Pristis pectinata]